MCFNVGMYILLVQYSVSEDLGRGAEISWTYDLLPQNINSEDWGPDSND